MKPLKNPKNPTASNEKKIHLNERSKNSLFEYLSMEIFDQVFRLTKANEIWLKLHGSMMVQVMSMSKNIA